TSDAAGECDCSFRAGTVGFLRVLDERTIAYPEFRGNGVMASLGNILENPHIGIFMVDFTHDLIGLHINGNAEILTPAHMQELDRGLPGQATHPGRRPVQWVLVRVAEAYIHCSKHIPKLVPQSRVRHWGTDNPRHKGGDYFGAVAPELAERGADRVPERSMGRSHQRRQALTERGCPVPAITGCGPLDGLAPPCPHGADVKITAWAAGACLPPGRPRGACGTRS